MPIFPQSLTWPRRVLSGPGSLSSLPEEAGGFGNRGVLVHGRSLGRSKHLEGLVDGFPGSIGLSLFEHAGGEPTLDKVEDLRRTIRQQEADWVAAVGGGSVLDLAKAAAALAGEPAPAGEYHRGEPIRSGCLPILAVPAVPGSGSESTGVSVLIDPQRLQKKAIRSPGMFPAIVVLDPALPAGCPSRVLAHSGLDGLTQAIESFLSLGSTGFTEDLSRRGIRLFAGRLTEAAVGRDDGAIADLQAASFLTGLAFSASRLGVVHGLVHPLGARLGLPHGQLCGLCLPLALEFNREAAPAKYSELEGILGGDPVRFANDLLEELGVVNPLQEQTVPDLQSIAAETLESGSTAHNPRPVTEADVAWFLDGLFRAGPKA